MRVVTTAMKNHPSNRESFDRMARRQRSVSSYTPASLPRLSRETWRKNDITLAGAKMR